MSMLSDERNARDVRIHCEAVADADRHVRRYCGESGRWRLEHANTDGDCVVVCRCRVRAALTHDSDHALVYGLGACGDSAQLSFDSY